MLMKETLGLIEWSTWVNCVETAAPEWTKGGTSFTSGKYLTVHTHSGVGVGVTLCAHDDNNSQLPPQPFGRTDFDIQSGCASLLLLLLYRARCTGSGIMARFDINPASPR